jgi:hypothetical protein
VDIKVGGTDTVHIDASGIGVNINNPLYPLHVTEASGGDTAAIFIDGPTDGISALFMGDSDDIDIGAIQYNHSSNYMFFRTNASERMRIDSSGNVGIGVTAPSDSTNNGDNLVIGGESNVGMSFLSNATSGNGAIYFADGTSGTAAYRGILSYSHSDDAMDFGTASTAARMRIDSSGNVKIISGNVQFGASGSETGQIEINSTRLLLRSTGDASGLRFDGSAYTPFKNGSQADGTVDLGSSSGKYKDLYLGGGLYVGGTGSANQLDDYEEGTWVPVFQNDGSTQYTVQLGKYRKIGDVVIATFHIDILTSNGIGSNQLKIENLPFTVANSSNQYGNTGGLHCSSWSTTTKPDNGLAIPNTTRLEFYRSEGQTAATFPTGNDLGNGNVLGHVIFFVS